MQLHGYKKTCAPALNSDIAESINTNQNQDLEMACVTYKRRTIYLTVDSSST